MESMILMMLGMCGKIGWRRRLGWQGAQASVHVCWQLSIDFIVPHRGFHAYGNRYGNDDDRGETNYLHSFNYLRKVLQVHLFCASANESGCGVGAKAKFAAVIEYQVGRRHVECQHGNLEP